MKIGLQVLRAKIRGLQAAGVSLHLRIRKSKGLKRNELWIQKRNLGNVNREHLIAYGLLRGVHYASIEKCSPQNKPNANSIFELMKTHADWLVSRELTVDKVKALLENQENVQPSVEKVA